MPPAKESIYNLVAEGPVAPSGPPRVNVRVPVSASPQSPSSAKNKISQAAHHKNSSQISNILNPVKGVRDQMLRNGKQPVNHARNNYIAVQEQSSKNQLKKFQEIAELDAKAKGRAVGPKPSSTRGQQAPRDPLARDYVRDNKVDAGAASKVQRKPKEEEETKEDWKQKENYGKVPKYLQERKMELMMQEEARREAEAASAIPPGMRLMPEDERQRTLKLLEENKKDIDQKLRALPFTCETPSQIRRKTELEKQMAEIEEAQRIFGRKQVFVRA